MNHLGKHGRWMGRLEILREKVYGAFVCCPLFVQMVTKICR